MRNYKLLHQQRMFTCAYIILHVVLCRLYHGVDLTFCFTETEKEISVHASKAERA